MATPQDSTILPTLETHEDALKERNYVNNLIAACRAEDAVELEGILRKVEKGKRHILNLKYEDDTTPLHEACCYGAERCINLLLENGADANVYDARGFAPMHCAASSNHTTAMDTLLNFSPQETDFTGPCRVDQQSEYGETPLHVACLAGCVDTAMFLHGRKADMRCVDSCGNTFLHCVSASDDGPLWGWVQEMLNNNRALAQLVNKKNSWGQTPAHVAASLGCVISISALFKLKANFGLPDNQKCTAIDILHQHHNIKCYSIATGQGQGMDIPSSPMPTRASVGRTLSNGSSSSPKVQRRSSMTGRKRPANMTISLPPSSAASSHAVLRRNSNQSVQSGGGTSSTVHSRSSSLDGFLNVSKEDLALSRLSSMGSEETIQMVIDNSAYSPPLDLNVVEPLYMESITPTKSIIYCKEHAIKFSTSYFNNKSKSKSSKTSKQEASSKSHKSQPETDIPVCIGAAMHLHIRFPSDYTIISPVCFISCRCAHTCRATLELPHAASISAGKRDKKTNSLFSILTFVTYDLKRSTKIKSPSPIERRLDPVHFDSLDIENSVVRFKATIENPCLYALGIRNGAVPRPPVPLRCAVFCLYKRLDDQLSISDIPIKIYVGLNLATVTVVMQTEARATGCEIQDLLFSLSGEEVQLRSSLDNSAEQWMLDTARPQKLKYLQIALTEAVITEYISYSHSHSYPPFRTVRVIPGSSPSHIKFMLSVLDSESRIIGCKSFVPFAPLINTSATATPNSSPPPSHRSFAPNLTAPALTVTSASPSPPLRSTHQETSLGAGTNGTTSVGNHSSTTSTRTKFVTMV